MKVKKFSAMFRFAVLAICLVFIDAYLTQNFQTFLNDRFGNGSAQRFARIDMGQNGSFGGRKDNTNILTHRPIVFVHGLTLRASSFMLHHYFFIQQGYSESELYATTYADGGKTPFFSKTMNCEDVKQIREFFKAVYLYTNSTIDVIAYSMGVAISRKAILGGRCVDNGEYLGSQITRIVNVYVAIAGVANGYEKCLPTMKACNKKNGMVCNSLYIRDVNSQVKSYEGAYTYALYSSDDNLVGQDCCGKTCSALKNANDTYVVTNMDHIAVFFYTIKQQYEIIKKHSKTTD